MSKLAQENKFLDLSDYGRAPAKLFAKSLVNTPFTPVHVTLLFLVIGLFAIFFILNEWYLAALIFIILKSTVDAADGELARLRNKPSYIGRFLDSNLDLLLNFGILYAIYSVTNGSLVMMIVAFLAMQLQGTVFNYYYTILRNNLPGGDTTSRIQENGFPKALHGENQQVVNVLFVMYKIFYGVFDKIIYALDSPAKEVTYLPKWFMTFVSIYGLGFQLLIIGVMLVVGLIEIILPFMILYSIFIFILIGIRKLFIVNKSTL